MSPARILRKAFVFSLVIILTAAVFTGCGKKNDETEDKDTKKTETAGMEDLRKGKAAYEIEDYHAAAMSFSLAAQDGNAEAQFLLGKCYMDGTGVEQDFNKAEKWLKKAADQGHAEAQFLLGKCYQYGKGVEQDFDKAMKWIAMAADQGHAEAKEVCIFDRLDAFERLVDNADIPLERLESDAAELTAEFEGGNPARHSRIGRYVVSHVNNLLEKRRSEVIAAEEKDTAAKETIAAYEKQIAELKENYLHLETTVLPKYEADNEELRKEGEVYHSQLIAAKHDLVKSREEYDVLSKTREKELAASDEQKRNTVRQSLYQLVVTQRFSFARQILTTEQLRSPRIEPWCTEMMRRIDFLNRVYDALPEGKQDLDKLTQEDIVAAYYTKYSDDAERPRETILCAFEILCGNYDKAAQLRPEDLEIPATADAIAEELVSAARTLHVMGEKNLPAMFEKTMLRLPKTPQTTAAASTINVLFSGFPQKN